MRKRITFYVTPQEEKTLQILFPWGARQHFFNAISIKLCELHKTNPVETKTFCAAIVGGALSAERMLDLIEEEEQADADNRS